MEKGRVYRTQGDDSWYITSSTVLTLGGCVTGSLLEVVSADVSQIETLPPELFKDVVAVVACMAAIVKPKEGDTEDRAKYYQGIKVSE